MKRIGHLHLLTDTDLQTCFSHTDLTRLALAGGADTIQFRQKSGTTRDLIAIAKAIRDLTSPKGVPFIVNDRVDVAIAADADGVHLGQDDFPVNVAREMLGPDRIIGVSVGSSEEAREGQTNGADYVGFGPIYATGSKGDAGEPQSLDRRFGFVQSISLPVIAIGGIGQEKAESVIGAGAHGLAVISAICCQEDPEEATRDFAEKIKAAREAAS